ncbi:MAG: hypothetical protein A2289_13530 [Deltaproteobacteria bacterium RIFOXYA12_FULL_58_15]|nr:MAG: hypothetical protein A2289_13530 [Deltaproteobacteria bacterium RIFOXYA12_FULL_58_15]OGR09544.1 MAG: hypothetical protein A2341_16675 [Deltaproteobacteria bacterium RIFOXYB12_FULL_58_9]
MQSKWPQRIAFIFAFSAILGVVLYVGGGLFRSSNAGTVVNLVNGVAKGVSHYAGSNGGVIPPTQDLLNELEQRNLLASDYQERLPGYSLSKVLRMGPAQFQIHLDCPPDERGREACDQILDLKSAEGDSGVLRTDGRGTGKITFDMQL